MRSGLESASFSALKNSAFRKMLPRLEKRRVMINRRARRWMMLIRGPGRRRGRPYAAGVCQPPRNAPQVTHLATLSIEIDN